MAQSSTTTQQMEYSARRGLFVNNRDSHLEAGERGDDQPLSFHWGLTSILPMRQSAAGRADAQFYNLSQPTSSTSEHFPHMNLPGLESNSNIQSPVSAVCSVPAHDRACLLARRTEMRQKKAWIRQRHRPPFNTHRPLSSRRTECAACILAIVLLIVIVSTYVGLLLSNSSLSTPVHITFILLLVLATVSIIYTCFRLYSASASPPKYSGSPIFSTTISQILPLDWRRSHHHRHIRHRRHRRPNLNWPDSPRGADALPSDDSLYSPSTPIRVFLFNDETLLFDKRATTAIDLSLVGSDSNDNLSNNADTVACEQVNAPPPAYGLWRCSVRADPNLLHWQPSPTRNDRENTRDNVYAEDQASGTPQIVSQRPPSYVSTHERGQQISALLNDIGQISRGDGGVVVDEQAILSENAAVQEVTRNLLSEQR